jgi:predicted ATP-dependent endonuclease of OLD family
MVETNYAHIEQFFQSNEDVEMFTRERLQFGKNSQGNDEFGILIPMHQPQIVSYFIVKMITVFFKKIRIFSAHRQAVSPYTKGEKRELIESGANLIEVMNTMLSEDRVEYQKINDQYNVIFGSQFDVHVPLDQTNITHIVKTKESGLDSQTDFLNMSTGLHEILILLFAIEKAKPNETICIEEPEIHLHASVQKRLFRYIIDHSSQNQFFLTTHSPIFTGIEDNVRTHLITKSNAISNVTQIDEYEDLQLIKQQLGIRNSDIFGNDFIIFVEGDSEEYAFPIVAKTLGCDLGTDIGKRIRIINLHGNSVILKLEQFLTYLQASDTEVFLIADGDKKVSGSISDFISKNILKLDHSKIWQYEFEDTFESKRIIDAMKKLSNKNHFTFEMELTQLDAERSSGKKVVDILQKYLYEKTQPDLNKPELAQQLAYDIVDEIKSGMSRSETKFESEIKRIMTIINSKK